MPPLNPFLRTGLVLAIGQAMLAPANAASISVNTSGDAGTGSTCTLRQAIDSANSNLQGTSNCVAGEVASDTITFDAGEFPVANANTITLTSSLPIINSNLTEPCYYGGALSDEGKVENVLPFGSDQLD